MSREFFRKHGLLIIVTLAFVVLAAVGATGIVIQQTSTLKEANIQNLSPVELVKKGKAQLVDVRTIKEFMSSRAQNAINIPLSDIQKGDLTKFNKNLPIFLYCRTGHRAGQAKTILDQAGYRNITNLGGLADWQTQGGVIIF
jgi:phage shock protein E